MTYTAAANQIVACVLVNLRLDPPAPAPVPQPDPVPAPAGGGVGELDLRVTARAITPRVAAGADARWLVTVRNRSEVAATDVRLAAAVRQAGIRPAAGALTVTGGACVRSPSAGVCHVARIEPGRSVRLRARARSRRLSAPVRLVADAGAAEPEAVLANNFDRARVLVVRAAGSCPASAGARASC